MLPTMVVTYLAHVRQGTAHALAGGLDGMNKMDRMAGERGLSPVVLS